VPDDGKVCDAAEVLCHRDRVLQVEDDMPPPGGDIDCFTWPLEYFNLQENILEYFNLQENIHGE